MRRRDADGWGEDGFGLLEMCVVVLVVAVIIAIAIPTFLTASSRTKDTRAKSAASLATKTVMTSATTGFADLTATSLQQEEGSLTFVAGATASSGPGVVSATPVTPATGSAFIVAVRSSSGTCFLVRQETNGSQHKARLEDAADPCIADAYLTLPDNQWSPPVPALP